MSQERTTQEFLEHLENMLTVPCPHGRKRLVDMDEDELRYVIQLIQRAQREHRA
jgi:hypothetical protein